MKVVYEGMACIDCTAFLANGDEPQQGEKIAAMWGDDAPHVVCTSSEDTDREFSRAACDACGSTLAGWSRHAFAVLAVESDPRPACGE